MENKELQKIWKSINKEIDRKSEEELNLLLSSKAKQTINNFLVIMSVSIITGMGLIVYLTVTSVHRQHDLMYLANNITLGFLTLFSITTGLLSWYKIRNSRYNSPLKEWLSRRIGMLSAWLKGRFSKMYLFILPVFYILIVLSIHVYFENKLLTDVLKTQESVAGLIVGTITGLSVSYIVVRKIRKYQLHKLKFLEDLYNRLCAMN